MPATSRRWARLWKAIRWVNGCSVPLIQWVVTDRAQFVAIDTDLLAATPGALSDELAASLPVASGTALQALADVAQLRQGQAVLVTGASGAVGASAVQLSRSIGARITGVCGTANVDYVRSIGADRVVDYKTNDWLCSDAHFDVIFDAAASTTFSSARPRLTGNGIYITTMPVPKLFLAAFVARLTSRQRCVPFLLKTNAQLLERLAELAASNVIVPHIGEAASLGQVAAAQRRMQEGKAHGKVCVRVDT